MTGRVTEEDVTLIGVEFIKEVVRSSAVVVVISLVFGRSLPSLLVQSERVRNSVVCDVLWLLFTDSVKACGDAVMRSEGKK